MQEQDKSIIRRISLHATSYWKWPLQITDLSRDYVPNPPSHHFRVFVGRKPRSLAERVTKDSGLSTEATVSPTNSCGIYAFEGCIFSRLIALSFLSVFLKMFASTAKISLCFLINEFIFSQEEQGNLPSEGKWNPPNSPKVKESNHDFKRQLIRPADCRHPVYVVEDDSKWSRNVRSTACNELNVT